MKYKYITLYQIRGLIHNPDKGDVEIYAREDDAVRAILTDKHDDYCYEIDRALAVSFLMFKGVVGQRDAVEAEIGRIRERRNKKLDASETLVFIAEGETEADFSSPNSETADYVTGFDIFKKEEIVAVHSNQVNAILAALCLSVEQESIQIRRLREGVYLINDLGKPVYSFNVSGSAEVYTSRRTTDEVITEVSSQVNMLIDNGALSRVYRLLVQSISRDNDELRRFMFSWSALEILINKVFSEYEKQFIQNLLGANPAAHTQRYFERMRDVMKKKYRLTDKFIIVAACLDDTDDTTVEADIERFISIKGIRDALLHGETMDEESLPISDTVALLKKYLRRHINAK